jgi:hypothetical protein
VVGGVVTVEAAVPTKVKSVLNVLVGCIVITATAVIENGLLAGPTFVVTICVLDEPVIGDPVVPRVTAVTVSENVVLTAP